MVTDTEMPADLSRLLTLSLSLNSGSTRRVSVAHTPSCYTTKVWHRIGSSQLLVSSGLNIAFFMETFSVLFLVPSVRASFIALFIICSFV